MSVNPLKIKKIQFNSIQFKGLSGHCGLKMELFFFITENKSLVFKL